MSVGEERALRDDQESDKRLQGICSAAGAARIVGRRDLDNRLSPLPASLGTHACGLFDN